MKNKEKKEKKEKKKDIRKRMEEEKERDKIEISVLCSQQPLAHDYIYENAARIAAKWFREFQPVASNPVIANINWGSAKDFSLVCALREAYVAGMIMGSCLQQDLTTTEKPRI